MLGGRLNYQQYLLHERQWIARLESTLVKKLTLEHTSTVLDTSYKHSLLSVSAALPIQATYEFLWLLPS